MKNTTDAVPQYFIFYEDALKKEAETGRTIVSDREVKVIIRQKDNTFKMKSLENDKSYMIDTKLLAFELSERETEEFSTEQIIALKKVGKKYKRIEFEKPFYFLIDYDFEPLVKRKDKRLYEVSKSSQGFDLSRLDNIDEATITKRRMELRNSAIGSDIYIEVEESDVAPEYRKYISAFISDHLGEYHLVDHTFYLIPYVEFKNWSKTSYREYLHVLSKGVPAIVCKSSNDTIEIVPYSIQTRNPSSKTLMYAINPITALEVLYAKKSDEKIKACLLEVHRGLNGYKFCEKEVEKRLELN